MKITPGILHYIVTLKQMSDKTFHQMRSDRAVRRQDEVVISRLNCLCSKKGARITQINSEMHPIHDQKNPPTQDRDVHTLRIEVKKKTALDDNHSQDDSIYKTPIYKKNVVPLPKEKRRG